MIAIPKHTDISQEEFEFYTQKHQGKNMVIKVSGAEFQKKEFSQLIETIHLLLQNDITIFLIFGGGIQIDQFYKKNSDTPNISRVKINGVGVTTPEVLEIAVLPAYKFLIKKLENYFLDMPYSYNTISTKDLIVSSCLDCEKFGFVANPQTIIIDKSKNLHIIGFVGENKSGQKFNVNADEIALSICKQHKIDEVIFITGTGGILDNCGNIISKISKRELCSIIQHTNKKISVSDGMQKKCNEILELLKIVPKVVLATSETLQQELFTEKGAGTLLTK